MSNGSGWEIYQDFFGQGLSSMGMVGRLKSGLTPYMVITHSLLPQNNGKLTLTLFGGK